MVRLCFIPDRTDSSFYTNIHSSNSRFIIPQDQLNYEGETTRKPILHLKSIIPRRTSDDLKTKNTTDEQKQKTTKKSKR